MIVFDGDVEVLSNVLDFAVGHIVIFVVIIVIVGDIVDDVGGVTSLAVFGFITLTFWLTFVVQLACLLDDFALWVDSSTFELECLS